LTLLPLLAESNLLSLGLSRAAI